MTENVKRARVKLDGVHSLNISVDNEKKTVFAELESLNNESVLIYAEKLENTENCLKKAIKKGITYLDTKKKNETSNFFETEIKQ